MVVPAGHPRWAPGRCSASSPATGPRTRLARLLLGLAVRSGGADRLARGTLEVTGPAGADSVDRVLRRPARPRAPAAQPAGEPAAGQPQAGRAGLRRVRQRPGLRQGRATTPSPAGSSRPRAASLEQVAAAGLEHVRVPAVLGRLEWHGLSLLVLEPLPPAAPAAARCGRRPGPPAAGPRDRRASAACGPSPSPAPRCRPRSRPSSPPADRAATGCSSTWPRSTPPRVDLVHGAWHGDLNPGNVALVAGRSLGLGLGALRARRAARLRRAAPRPAPGASP